MRRGLTKHRWGQAVVLGGLLTVVGSWLPWFSARVTEEASVYCVSISGQREMVGIATAGGFGTFLLGLLVVALTLRGGGALVDGALQGYGSVVLLVTAHSFSQPTQHQLIGVGSTEPIAYTVGVGTYVVVAGGLLVVVGSLYGYHNDGWRGANGE